MTVTAEHRVTLERIFSHPTGANIEWRQVLSLLEGVGFVTEEHNGNLKVALGGKTEVLRLPREKDVDKQTIVELGACFPVRGWRRDVSRADPPLLELRRAAGSPAER
jgi:hypothetical protein